MNHTSNHLFSTLYFCQHLHFHLDHIPSEEICDNGVRFARMIEEAAGQREDSMCDCIKMRVNNKIVVCETLEHILYLLHIKLRSIFTSRANRGDLIGRIKRQECEEG